MRRTIDSQQRSFFYKEQKIEFEALLNKEELSHLLLTIKQKKKALAFNEGKFLSRSLDSLIKLIRRKQLAEIAFELTGDKPLRLAYDLFFDTLPAPFPPTLSQLVETSQTLWGVLLPLEGEKAGNGIYFHDNALSSLSIEPSCWHLLLVFTKDYLREEQHPIVFR